MEKSHRTACLMIAALAWLIATGAATARDELIYVKQETREATRRASLEASGRAVWPGGWHLIGPFENTSLSAMYPPEQEINLAASYPGKGGEQAVWRPFDFPDGQIHDLKRFQHADRSICYLYRQIDSPVEAKVRVSLGSDDGLAIWLNGERLLFNDTVRGTSADQDFCTLPLKAGRNDLLLKISNGQGQWSFYFNPTMPARLEAKLQRLLDRDFPADGEAGHYRLETLPLPDNELIEGGGLAFRGDGKLYVATRRGDIWLVSNPTSDDVDQIEMKLYARGLHEVLGLTVVGENDLYLVQRPEITLVRDTDGDDEADEFITINDQFGCSGDYHEYLYGPARDTEGNFFVTLNVGFGGGHQSKVPYRGFCLKVDPQGQPTPWAYGLRSPNGVNFSPDGRLYYTDNQGEWVAACKLHEIRQGEFYGHMASVRWWPGKTENDRPEMTPPAIWFPYHLSKSATEPVWDTTEGKFGPFAGQCFVGELTNSSIVRVDLEEVQGRMQGACFAFRHGFQCGVNRLEFAPDGSLFVAETNRGWGSVGGQPHGLQRLVYTGNVPFEIHSMRITQQGWDLRFTKPVDPLTASQPANYFLESYTYHHWGTYGSPEIERREDAITQVQLGADGQTVHVTVPDRRKRFVFHLQLKNVKAADGAGLLHPDAYYTMNETP